MGTCVEKLPHGCGSSDGLQVFFHEDTGRYQGFCFSCRTPVDNPYADGREPAKANVLSPEEIEEKFNFIFSLQSMDIPTRKLKKASLEYFNVRVGVSEEDGTSPAFLHFPSYSKGFVEGWKTKILGSKIMWWTGSKGEPFGWEQAIKTGMPTLYITEGEEDAIALYQVLKRKAKGGKWEDANPAVISVTTGVLGVQKELTAVLPRIRSLFKDVVLCFDMDEQGNDAVENAKQLLPNAKRAILPAKDANEALIRGYSKALANAVIFNSTSPKNTRIKWGTEFIESAREEPEWGYSWPWKGLTEKTRGIRIGETIYIGAGVKMGKSEIVNALGWHFISEHKMPIFMAKPEEANKKTFKLLVGKAAGKVFHDPNVPFDYDAYDKAAPLVASNVAMLDLYQHLDYSTLRDDIIAANNAGVRVVFIDPITNLTNGINSGEANTQLQGISQDLSALVKDLEMIAFIFCHLKAPESGDPHERGGNVLSHQFAGSRAMMRSCNMMLGLEGNKDPNLSLEARNVRKLVLLEEREFGASGYIDLYWDHHTGLFTEIT